MRIKISIEPVDKKKISLPNHYNCLLQGFLYKNFDKVIADKIHNKGYRYGRREFRLFTFSRLLGEFRLEKGNIFYKGKCILWVASPITEILESFACNLARRGMVKLGNNHCQIASIEVPFSQDYKEDLLVRAISPITVYSTLLTRDKKKKTYNYTPFEREFSELIKRNLLKKYAVVNKLNECPSFDFSITPERISNRNEHIVLYKRTVIKGWSGVYRIKGNLDLIKLAFDCGMGAKNSQGFGMIEKYEMRGRE
jgi:CRISPR-associated endoribonuclease Cas6